MLPTLLAALAFAAPADLAWTPPAGWRDVSPQLTQLSEPRQQLAAATFDVRQIEAPRDCSPATARRQMPLDGGSAGP